MLIPIKFDLHC